MTPPLALITGAAGGIGQALVVKLARRGIDVVACDREHSAALDLAARPAPRLGQLHSRELDVTDAEQVNALVDTIETELGPIDLLANVAGVLSISSALELTDPDWQRIFAVNSTGVMNVSRTVGQRMAERGRGSIVTVGSNAGTVPRVGMAAYCASKAAARMFTQVLALELASSGVRANIVSPGSTDTPMLQNMLAGADTQTLIAGDLSTYKTGVPLGQIATPDAVADAVAFLFSDAAAHITMHDLRVDGGATLGR